MFTVSGVQPEPATQVSRWLFASTLSARWLRDIERLARRPITIVPSCSSALGISNRKVGAPRPDSSVYKRKRQWQRRKTGRAAYGGIHRNAQSPAIR